MELEGLRAEGRGKGWKIGERRTDDGRRGMQECPAMTHTCMHVIRVRLLPRSRVAKHRKLCVRESLTRQCLQGASAGP